MMSQTGQTLCAIDTGYYADTVEWCPLKPFDDILACGTYQLLEGCDENKAGELEGIEGAISRRVGNIQLHKLEEQDSSLAEQKRVETAGILDMKWLSHFANEQAVLGAVSSEGEVKIFSLALKKLGASGYDFVEQSCYQIDKDKLGLSMDWSPDIQPRNRITVSDSGGQITLLEFVESSWELKQLLQWTGHQYEAWITAFDAWNPSVVYSGGDDCLLKGWDTRTDCHNAIFTSKRHSMGVSSIQCNPTQEYLMATGSYDENIFVWDTRSMKKPLCSASPGGGVWRIKWHPHTGTLLLAPCMYEGFHLLEFANNTGNQGLRLSGSYTKHSSIAYGADWCRREVIKSGNNDCDDGELPKENEAKSVKGKFDHHSDLKDSNYVATCSFYDHLLHLWKACYSI